MDWVQKSLFDGEKQYKVDKPIRLIELFAGIGAQAKALESLGAEFEHYRICEFDKYAVQSYNAVHGTNFKTSDITKIKAADLGIAETNKYEYIMTYSFPCTDLSVAGKQAGMSKGSGTRSGLLWEVERLLKECKELPQVLLMENVPQVLNCDFGGWLDFLDNLGYKNYYEKLNAKNFGIPQNRERCFMVSVLGNYYYDFPKEIPLKLRLKDMLEEKVDEKYYLRAEQLQNIKFNDVSGIEEKVHIKEIGKLKPHRHSSTANSVLDDTGICPTLDTMGGGNREPKILEPTILTPKRTEYGKAIRKDYEAGLHKESRHNFTQLEPKQEPTSNTITTVQKDNMLIEPRIFDIYNQNEIKNGICGTLTSNGNTSSTHCGTFGVMENNYRIRKLTPKECWRLMGFDDSDFDKAKASGVSNSQLYKQAGNSIVVNVLEAIFKQIL